MAIERTEENIERFRQNMDDVGAYYKRKEDEARTWRELLAYARTIKAPQPVLAVLVKALDITEYTGD